MMGNYFHRRNLKSSIKPNDAPSRVIIKSNADYRDSLTEITGSCANPPCPLSCASSRTASGRPRLVRLVVLPMLYLERAGTDTDLRTVWAVQQLGAVEYARPRKFVEKLHQWLKTIRLVWPECPAQITAEGEALSINPAKSIHSAVRRESRSECLD